MSINDRARTDAQKEEIMERLLHVWKSQPYLRLAQLLTVASNNQDIFYLEDYKLLQQVEDWHGFQKSLEE